LASSSNSSTSQSTTSLLEEVKIRHSAHKNGMNDG
jgi:hypothetical protein